MKKKIFLIGALLSLTILAPQFGYAQNPAAAPAKSDNLILNYKSSSLSLTWRHIEDRILFPHLSITKPWGNAPAEGAIGAGYFLLKEQDYSFLGEVQLNFGSTGGLALQPKFTLNWNKDLFSGNTAISYKFPLDDAVKPRLNLDSALYFKLDESWKIGVASTTTFSEIQIVKMEGKRKVFVDEWLWAYKIGPTIKYKVKNGPELEFQYLRDIKTDAWETGFKLNFAWK